MLPICVGGLRGGLHVGGRVHCSPAWWPPLPGDWWVRVDFEAGGEDGASEDDEEDEERVGVRGRLEDIAVG